MECYRVDNDYEAVKVLVSEQLKFGLYIELYQTLFNPFSVFALLIKKKKGKLILFFYNAMCLIFFYPMLLTHPK